MMVDQETGKEMTFADVVSALLVAEHSRSKDDADRMVKEHTSIVVNGIMANMNYRATAMALEMAEDRKNKPVEA